MKDTARKPSDYKVSDRMSISARYYKMSFLTFIYITLLSRLTCQSLLAAGSQVSTSTSWHPDIFLNATDHNLLTTLG